MRISVAIPVRNGERFLEDCLRSALEQTRPADEVFVLDDASTDQSAAVAQSSRWEGRVGYRFNSAPSGLAGAWNRCVEHASGDFVALLHQDDLLAPGFLAAVARSLAVFPAAGHLFCGCHYIDSEGKTEGGTAAPWFAGPTRLDGAEYAQRYLHGVLRSRHIHRCPGTITARSLVLDACPFRHAAGQLVDDDFFYRIGGFTQVIGVPERLASFRHHEASATRQLDSLAVRLAHDYSFLRDDYVTTPVPLDAAARALLAGQARRFMTQALFEGVVSRRDDWVETAVRLRSRSGPAWPQDGCRGVATWGRILWGLQGTAESGRRAARAFASVVRGAVGLRRRLRAGARRMGEPRAAATAPAFRGRADGA